MSDDTPHLKLPFLAEGQQSKTVTVNDALNRLDALVQIAVKDRDLAAPPATPAEGDRYIVAAGGSGVWSGCDGQLAAFFDGAWTCFVPQDGWSAWIADEHVLVVYCDGAWSDWSASLGALQNLALLGIGTTADASNPFSAKLNSALWTAKTAAEGGSGDLRYVFNKEATANSGSVLFQDGFSGRAEIGLTGDDDFHFKVSPDGSTWVDALVLAHADGAVRFPVGVTGGVVQPQTRMALDAMASQPSVGRRRLLDELLGELIYHDIWDGLDALWVLAAHSEQAARLNLRSPGVYDLAPVNAPIFATDRGFKSDGSTSYLRTGVVPGAADLKFVQDDNAMGVWSLDQIDEANALIGSNSYAINPLSGGEYRLRDSASSTDTPSSTSSLGHFVSARADATGYAVYHDGALGASVSRASAAPAAEEMWLCGWNSSQYSIRRVAAAHVGAALSADAVGALHRALLTYLEAVGALE